MAANYLGMLGYGADEATAEALRQREEQRAALLGQMTPQGQVGYARARGGQMLGAGVGEMLRGGLGAATGVDTRNADQRRAGVRDQLQRALAGVDPSDVEKFYPILIRVLSDNGMIAEATQAAREYEEIRNKRRDDERATRKDDAAAIDRTARTELLRRGTPLQQNVEALGVLYAQLAALPADAPTRKGIAERIRVMEDALAKKNIQIKDGGDRLHVYVNGDLVSSEPKGVDPTAKYRADHPRPTGTGGGVAGPVTQPTSRPIKSDMVDDNDRDIYTDNRGNQWVQSGAGGWDAATSGGRNTGDRGLPTSIGKMVAVNEGTLGVIDLALKTLGSKEARDALGPKAYLNRWMDTLDRLDAAGVGMRGMITNLMSSTLHARSGAAVTVQEFDRLRGFLPQTTDSAQVVINKLRSMHQVAVIETNALREGNGGAKKEYGAPGTGAAPVARAPAAPVAAPAAGGLPPGVTVRVRGG